MNEMVVISEAMDDIGQLYSIEPPIEAPTQMALSGIVQIVAYNVGQRIAAEHRALATDRATYEAIGKGILRAIEPFADPTIRAHILTAVSNEYLTIRHKPQ